jgi:hypothetical protein
MVYEWICSTIEYHVDKSKKDLYQIISFLCDIGHMKMNIGQNKFSPITFLLVTSECKAEKRFCHSVSETGAVD